MTDAPHWVGWVTAEGLHGHFAEPYPFHGFALDMARRFERSWPNRKYGVIAPDQIDAWKEQEKMEAETLEAGPRIRNQRGDMVPERLVPGRMRLEDQAVRSLIEGAKAQRDALVAFKARAFGDISAFRELLAATYHANIKGFRGGGVLTSYDGCAKVEVSHADNMTFGPELESAKALIDACIQDWSDGTNENLQTLVNGAFRVGEGGRIRVDRVLELRQLNIDDARWQQAMVAIGDALRVNSSRAYIRFYERANPDAEWQQVVLNMSAL